MRPVTVSRIAGLAAMTAIGVFVPISAAGAVEYPNGGTPPTVNPAGKTQAVANKAAAKPNTLPLTGTDVGQLVAIGGVAIGAGFVITRRSRRTSTT